MRVGLVSRLLLADHPRARLGACREVMEGGLAGLTSCGSAREEEIMSYPAPVPRDRGEQTATCRRASHPPEVQRAAGTAVHYLATGTSTSGQFGPYHWEMGAGPGGPDPHFHRTISESL
jgi:hypothetical protein